jgi:glutaredoxin
MTHPTILMHSKPDCPFCDTARAYFAQHAIPFTEIKHDDAADRQALYDTLGLVGKARTVPQILLRAGDDPTMHIGGAKQLLISGLPSLFMDLKAVQVPVAVSIAVGDVAVEDDGVCEACQ